jgi:hypothetical protein
VPIVDNHERYATRLGKALERLILVTAMVCIALLRLFARLISNALDLFVIGFSRCGTLGAHVSNHTAPRLSSWLSTNGTKYRNRTPRPIPGLDGPLCMGQPVPPRLIPTSEIAALRARVLVASFGAIVIGFIAVAVTPEHKDSPRALPATLAVQDNPPPPKFADRLTPKPFSGFAVLTATRAHKPLPALGLTIAEMMSITRPLNEGIEQSDATALDVPVPLRKPEVNINAKPKPMKQKQTRTAKRTPQAEK